MLELSGRHARKHACPAARAAIKPMAGLAEARDEGGKIDSNRFAVNVLYKNGLLFQHRPNISSPVPHATDPST